MKRVIRSEKCARKIEQRKNCEGKIIIYLQTYSGREKRQEKFEMEQEREKEKVSRKRERKRKRESFKKARKKENKKNKTARKTFIFRVSKCFRNRLVMS